MLVTIDHCGARRARLHLSTDATAADLAHVVAGTAATAVCIDGIPLAPDRPLRAAGLHAGSHVTIGRAEPPPPGPHPGASIVVSGGLQAGQRWPLRRAPVVVGRAGDADLRIDDPTVSCRHLTICAAGDGPTVIDLESHNGTTVGIDVRGCDNGSAGQTVELGATRLRLDLTPPSDAVALGPPDSVDGRVCFDRPPRPAPPPTEPPLRPPPAPALVGGRTVFSWAMFLAPLAIGLVLALVFNPLMGALALLSPVVMVASWYESRRRERRATREGRQAFDRALDQFLRDLDTRRTTARLASLYTHPDAAEVVRRATTASQRLWERRPGRADALVVRIGVGNMPWCPPIDEPHASPHPDLADALAGWNELVDAPVTLDLSKLRVIGLAGAPGAVDAVARALVMQAAVHQGPADLDITAVDASHHAAWMSWLPHWTDTDQPTSRHLLVVAGGSRPLAPGSPARQLADRGTDCTVVVLGEQATTLPASCSMIVEITDAGGGARLEATDGSRTPSDVRLDGMSLAVAEHAARALAHLRDPERDGDARIPDASRLLDLLDLPDPQAKDLETMWCEDDDAIAILGAGADGVVALDLDRDGPHLLVGGTTGAGKSELLRTLVAGLAARRSPDDLTFVLVDFKGGSAFDVCADLPHTVGVVTDLDGRAGERALRSLEAEVRRRELLLREAGATDRVTYRAAYRAAYRVRRESEPMLEPLPRLVVVVDEFATLAREVPDVLAALVDVAQRGRSLGIHLVLATQRPAGVVNDHIRTNTNVRIALRVVDPADSTDLIGVADAARLESRPGRAILRCGQAAITTFQVAHVSADGTPDTAAIRVDWVDEPTGGSGVPAVRAITTDLDRLVRAAGEAWSGHPSPHRPWLDPLPVEVTARDLDRDLGAVSVTDSVAETDAGSDAAADGPPDLLIGIADDPDHQCRRPVCWAPRRGALLLVGLPGSGCSTALSTAVHASAAVGADMRHIYIVGSPAEHGALTSLSAVGGVIDPADTERLRALLRLLERQVEGSGPVPRVLVAVDGLRLFLDAVDRASGMAGVDRWLHLLTARPGCIEAIVTADRLGAVPGALGASTSAKLLFRLGDPYDYAAVGLPPVDARSFPPGRAIDARTGLETQVLTATVPSDDGSAPDRRPDPLEVLPTTVHHSALTAGLETAGPAGFVVGVLDGSRSEATVDLRGGDHLLVVGPDGSGRSTTLTTLAASARLAGGWRVIITGAPRSALRASDRTDSLWVDLGDIGHAITACEQDGDEVLVLVDDADLLERAESLEPLVAGGAACLVAAVHPDRLRGLYGHWTDPLRRARFGIALSPRPHDGELWSTTLPGGAPTDWPPGRGYLLDHGRATLLQVALP